MGRHRPSGSQYGLSFSPGTLKPSSLSRLRTRGSPSQHLSLPSLFPPGELFPPAASSMPLSLPSLPAGSDRPRQCLRQMLVKRLRRPVFFTMMMLTIFFSNTQAGAAYISVLRRKRVCQATRASSRGSMLRQAGSEKKDIKDLLQTKHASLAAPVGIQDSPSY